MLLLTQDERTLYFYLIGSSILVFFLDAITPLGYAEWIFYLVPVALCSLGRKPQLPFVTAFLLTPLLILGYVLSPEGANELVAIVNRAMAFILVFAVAFLSRLVVNERLLAQRLMWIEKGRGVVSSSILGEPTIEELADKIVQGLAHYFNAQVAVFYRLDGDRLRHAGSFAVNRAHIEKEILPGEGMIGETAKSGRAIVLDKVPADHLQISSATAKGKPASLLIAPYTLNGQVAGVMEFGFLRQDDFKNAVELLQLVSDKIGSAMKTAYYRENMKQLLEETQRQSEELQAQQEELRVANEELGEQSRALQESQSQLELQHSDLETANVQLEERNQLLEQQRAKLFIAQQEVQKNVAELERANRYKSEFLANMSHELRTPLNSSLILSHMLAENKAGTLTEEQVRYARTIHAANNDLLTLINDILDLSKIESGQVDLNIDALAVPDLVNAMREMFEPMAQQKSLGLEFEVAPDAPGLLYTDALRLQQILKNLLSNTFKFTHQGKVTLAVSRHGERLRFAVKDTGIGISPEQQEVIFEAFRQADGSTSRTYGGTGLGLSISRHLAKLLGGDITVSSESGKGSVFTVEVPIDLRDRAAPAGTQPAPATSVAPAAAQPAKVPQKTEAPAYRQAEKPTPAVSPIQDDRDRRSRSRLILVVEDDPNFANILYELAHEMNFDCIHAATGSDAIRLAQEYKPDGVLLDIGLPDQSGLSVLESIKSNPALRHLPVHVVSVDEYMQTALEMGAIGYALKPAAREELAKAISRLESVLHKQARQVLIVEDNAPLRESLAAMLSAEDITITNASTIAEALDFLSSGTFDCMVMDLTLPDGSGYDLLEKISKGGKYAFPPVIVYTGRVLTREEEQRLRRYSQSIIIKGARSPERLLDEVTLFLHRVESSLPAEQQKLLAQARQRDSVFEGRRILIAEDDVRNVFALTAIFEPLGATLIIARDGEEALARLESDQPIDLVLMDIMMPKMDGLTAMRKLREMPQHKRLPVIALTAKAMADDRRNSLDAGASDYIAKPINVDQLVSLCRVWMPK
ncbi:MAG: response regulator [Burkholderiaceae bacterium]